ncbi:MAG: dihydrofolate reductase family protein [Candidatus Dojkabacteria bacterium]|uniref:Dihydrofolate reductase n=2 Tax=Candidatus Dojkabacteria TaxID=74243 RepID=A0A136KKS1_9BACT|nr:MAG: Dihydrofolate reductase [candidate division WS6 bacterium OLB21]MBW7953547.1 dihydrofolate reductase [Candidatus Dojkabacteria bacterium]WKZ27822.1 MAG: dihydrofolate reductase family protein [Candidatus Dojkabacteria bacterium]
MKPKLIMIMVCSLDGVIATDKNTDSFSWNSPEDKSHFRKLTKEIGTVIMGSKTFQEVGMTPLKGRKNIIVTSRPDDYKVTEDTFFISGNAEDVVSYLQINGIKTAAVVGGSSVNSQFLQAGLIDELYITVEPILFGKGLHLAESISDQVNLQLIDSQKLNEQGTMLLHYQVLNNHDSKQN